MRATGPRGFTMRALGVLAMCGCVGSTASLRAGASQGCSGVRLEVAADSTTVAFGQRPQVRASLANPTKTAVRLVRPGDGSSVGWRTPVIGWSVLDANDPSARHPAAPPAERGARDGNINALTRRDLLTVGPHTTEPLGEWIGAPSFPSPGSYRVVFYYRNDPAQEWKGVPLRAHDADAMRLVRTTAPCSLVSNELRFTVQ